MKKKKKKRTIFETVDYRYVNMGPGDEQRACTAITRTQSQYTYEMHNFPFPSSFCSMNIVKKEVKTTLL